MSLDTRKPDPNAPEHWICVTCGHEKGAHTRQDRTMGRCWQRPDNDFKKPACACKEFR